MGKYIVGPDVKIEESQINIFKLITEAMQAATREDIKANSIVINENLVKVPAMFGSYPAMICGLKTYKTSCELPEDYLFSVQHEPRIMTNADRIRAMSDEELKDSILAVQLGYKPWCDYHCENQGDDGCDKCIEKWLQQPAEEG